MHKAAIDVTIVAPEREMEDLRRWLLEDPSLRGRVTTVDRSPSPGELGPTIDTILVALGPGGVASALATALISWVRHRKSNLDVRVTDRNGRTVQISATHLTPLSAADLQKMSTQLARGWEEPTEDAVNH